MTNLLTYIFIFFFTFISSAYPKFADAYTDGLWINGEDSKLGSWNIADGNSLYVGQNGSDFANVKNRDDFEPISLTLTGLTVAGSLYSIQDSARKIYSWIEGKGYKGKTTYVDPISGEVYTSDAMLKDGAVDLATAAAISGAFKIGGKVVGKIKNGLNYKTLYRAVEPEELLSIKNTGKFIIPPGRQEIKDFAIHYKNNGALKYAKQVVENTSWGSNQYTIVKTSILKNKLKDPLINMTVDRGIRSVGIPENLLNDLTKPKILKTYTSSKLKDMKIK